MKKFLLSILTIFIISFLYLNQKVQIYALAYRLNEKYAQLNKLIDSRDELVYNFYQKASISKLNKWAKKKGLKFASAADVIILGPKVKIVKNYRHKKGLLTAIGKLFSSFSEVKAKPQQ